MHVIFLVYSNIPLENKSQRIKVIKKKLKDMPKNELTRSQLQYRRRRKGGEINHQNRKKHCIPKIASQDLVRALQISYA